MRKKFMPLLVAVGMLFVVIACNNSDNNEKQQSPQLQADTINATNDFYDDAETHVLPVNTINIKGEIENPGIVDFSKL
ncbi:MAG: hypothetical protein KAG99_04175, partial [Bacteroidales bacterium]|nr:hypothetical protein [Bacteroidales bacterium]